MRENQGWIKLHRKLLNNDSLFSAQSTFPLFCLLLLLANEDGIVTVGRHQLARWLKMKPSTVYLGLKRLENLTTVRLEPNNKMTIVSILNWDKYQSKPDNKITSTQQQNDTIQELRIKNKDISTNVLVERQAVQRVFNLFIQKFNRDVTTYKLTDIRKKKLRSRLKDAGETMLTLAINNTAETEFYRGDNDRGWTADLDFITRSYEQVEKLAALNLADKPVDLKRYT